MQWQTNVVDNSFLACPQRPLPPIYHLVWCMKENQDAPSIEAHGWLYTKSCIQREHPTIMTPFPLFPKHSPKHHCLSPPIFDLPSLSVTMNTLRFSNATMQQCNNATTLPQQCINAVTRNNNEIINWNRESRDRQTPKFMWKIFEGIKNQYKIYFDEWVEYTRIYSFLEISSSLRATSRHILTSTPRCHVLYCHCMESFPTN